MASFADLNIPISPEDNTFNRAEMALNLGYEVVAINNFVEEIGLKTGKKGKEKVISVQSADKLFGNKENQVSPGQNFRKLTRFSTVLTDSAQVIRLQKDEVIQGYDIISVQPTTEKLFLSACKDLEIDIIALDMTQRLSFFPKRTAVGCALERGIHFEILYSPMIRDSTARRNIITNSNMLVGICHGKNIIISSGCEKPADLRGPYDIINLALLFGLTEAQAKHAVSTNPRSVILHALSRKSAKGVLKISKTITMTSDEQWKLPSDLTNVQSNDDLNSEDSEHDNDEPPMKKNKL